MKLRTMSTALLLCACALLGAGDGSEDSPLTGEDIVRSKLDGRSDDELVALIESSQVAFDVADDMLDELARAGLSRRVIDAMVARQREIDRASAPADVPGEEVAAGAAKLTLRIDPGGKQRPGRLRLDDRIDPVVARQFQLGEGEHRITDLAIAVVCRTGDHVPDHWRGKTPLGRDFVATPRHRLLHFEPGAEFEDRKLATKMEKLGRTPGARDAVGPSRWAILRLPETIEVSVEEAVAHDLVLIVAIEIDGRHFYTLASDHLDGAILVGDGFLDATVDSGKGQLGNLKVELGKTLVLARDAG